MNHLYSKIILPACAILTMASCKDALMEKPVSFYSEETIFSTEAGVETAINGVYSSLQSGQYYGTSWHNLTMPHSGKFFTPQQANRDVASLNATPSNNWINDIWAQMYSTINAANIVIANLEAKEDELSNRDRVLGEAYFLRGLAYLDLVRLFGGVPLRTKPTQLDNIHLARNSRDEIIEQVVSDLSDAKKFMPQPAETRPGKPSRLAANVYLAKLYMTLAGEDNGDPSYWGAARNELSEVISSGAYQLTPTYAELFLPGNENTSESIFELQYDHTGGIRNSDIVRSFTPSNSAYAPSNVSTFGRIRPNKETFEQHFTQYPDDPRIDATFIYDEYDLANGGTRPIWPKRTTGNQSFTVIAKWFDPSYNGVTTARNLILLRYADVLLMMAEVENEINGPSSAYEYVNQVLNRARDIDGDGTSDSVEPADWSDMSKDEFRTRIFHERFYELLSEGHEWFDSRRRGYDMFISQVIGPHNEFPDLDLNREFIYTEDVKIMLLPLPLSEISGNQAITPDDQNPGY